MSQVDIHILPFVNLCSSLIRFTDKMCIDQPWERSPQERRMVTTGCTDKLYFPLRSLFFCFVLMWKLS
jgi:hypothetical protein